MAERVAVFPGRGRFPAVLGAEEDFGPGRCIDCGKQLENLSADRCRPCSREPEFEVVDRVRVMQAQGAKVPEIARRLEMKEGAVRRALGQADRLGRHRQKPMRAR